MEIILPGASDVDDILFEEVPCKDRIQKYRDCAWQFYDILEADSHKAACQQRKDEKYVCTNTNC